MAQEAMPSVVDGIPPPGTNAPIVFGQATGSVRLSFRPPESSRVSGGEFAFTFKVSDPTHRWSLQELWAKVTPAGANPVRDQTRAAHVAPQVISFGTVTLQAAPSAVYTTPEATQAQNCPPPVPPSPPPPHLGLLPRIEELDTQSSGLVIPAIPKRPVPEPSSSSLVPALQALTMGPAAAEASKDGWQGALLLLPRYPLQSA